jgi:hypothetical protein
MIIPAWLVFLFLLWYILRDGGKFFEGLGETVSAIGSLLGWGIAIIVALPILAVCVGGSKPHYNSKHFPHYKAIDVALVCAALFVVGAAGLCFFW